MKCTGPEQERQNQAVIDEGAARVLPHALAVNHKQEFFLKLGSVAYRTYFTLDMRRCACVCVENKDKLFLLSSVPAVTATATLTTI